MNANLAQRCDGIDVETMWLHQAAQQRRGEGDAERQKGRQGNYNMKRLEDVANVNIESTGFRRETLPPQIKRRHGRNTKAEMGSPTERKKACRGTARVTHWHDLMLTLSGVITIRGRRPDAGPVALHNRPFATVGPMFLWC